MLCRCARSLFYIGINRYSRRALSGSLANICRSNKYGMKRIIGLAGSRHACPSEASPLSVASSTSVLRTSPMLFGGGYA